MKTLSNPKSSPLSLPEQIAAMDAVNAARDSEELLNDEINIRERKSILRAKLKATYTASNIIVSDEIIEKGVDEFFANRYVFKKMPRGMNSCFAWAFVKRRALAIRSAIALGVVVSILVLNSLVGSVAAKQKKAAAEKQAASLVAAKEKAIKDKADAEAKEKANAAELAALPGQIKAVQDAIEAMAKEGAVKIRSKAMETQALGLVNAKDVVGARKIYGDLKGLLENLGQEYKITINPTPSFFWRSMDKNPNVKRYYIIVNCTDADGKLFPKTIKSEEDGSTKFTSQWAEQVSKEEYEKLRAEKQARGVIANPSFAEKEKGHLEPNYTQGLKKKALGMNKYDSELLRVTKW